MDHRAAAMLYKFQLKLLVACSGGPPVSNLTQYTCEEYDVLLVCESRLVVRFAHHRKSDFLEKNFRLT